MAILALRGDVASFPCDKVLVILLLAVDRGLLMADVGSLPFCRDWI